jgi:3-hydroxy-9,10-secoandrosta-1,3,5(10)-triene-9,17-dione monooxygenase
MTQAVLDGVRDLLPTFRERADEAERLRVVPEASIKELADTGFFRLLQPKRFDGYEADPVTFYRLGLQRGRRAPVAGRAVRR